MRETFYSYTGGAWSASWWPDQGFFPWEGGGFYAGAGLRRYRGGLEGYILVDLEVTSSRQTLLRCEYESNVRAIFVGDVQVRGGGRVLRKCLLYESWVVIVSG